ncbi:hypothetical protein QTP86_007412 [Hemibagrus guttatus]|nr:hypothetical protein QTP86_007412 [Hemibagrus guttatus]
MVRQCSRCAVGSAAPPPDLVFDPNCLFPATDYSPFVTDLAKSSLLIDPNLPSASSALQNTSPTVDPAEFAGLQEVVVHQGFMIRACQEQLAAVQATFELQQCAPSRAPPRPPFHPHAAKWCIWPSQRSSTAPWFANAGSYTNVRISLRTNQRHSVKRPPNVPSCYPYSLGGLLTGSAPEIAYYELQEVFSKERATHLPPHHHWDCAIDLLPNTMPPKCKVYPLSLTESKAMEDYIEEALAAGYIQPSTSPAATSSLWKCYYETDLIDWYVIVYIDDILIYSSSFNDHVHHVRTVPTCLHQHQLYAKAEKCEFHKDSFTFL